MTHFAEGGQGRDDGAVQGGTGCSSLYRGALLFRLLDTLLTQADKLLAQKMNGRFFGGRQISAFPMDGSKRYKKSGQEVSFEGTGLGDKDHDSEAAKREEERLEKYADWLERGGE